ncbi:MAG: J domain-containing protein [Nanoarchaeota archaeon]
MSRTNKSGSTAIAINYNSLENLSKEKIAEVKKIHGLDLSDSDTMVALQKFNGQANEQVDLDSVINTFNANVISMDQQQRKDTNSLKTMIKGATSGNLALLKQGIAALPFIGKTIVPFRSYSDLLVGQLHEVNESIDAIAEQINESEIAVSTVQQQMDDARSQRDEFRAKKDNYKIEVIDVRERLSVVQTKYDTLRLLVDRSDLSRAEEKTLVNMIGKTRLTKSDDVYINAHDKKIDLEDELFKAQQRLDTCISVIHSATNNIEFLSSYKLQTQAQIKLATNLYNNLYMKMEAIEPNVKKQMQQIKLSETVFMGTKAMNDLQNLANGLLVTVSEINSNAVEVTSIIKGDFYDENVLAFANSCSRELDAKMQMAATMNLINDEVPGITLTDAYTILGVTYGSEQEVIKKAYRKQAMKLHPDKNPNDSRAEQQFNLVQEAYKKISVTQFENLPTAKDLSDLTQPDVKGQE